MTYYYAQVKDGVVTDLLTSEVQLLSYDPTKLLIPSDYNSETGINISKEKSGLASDYCMVGYLFDPVGEGFYPSQPYPSWTLDKTTWKWEAPVPYPADGNTYAWDEATLSWVKIDNG